RDAFGPGQVGSEHRLGVRAQGIEIVAVTAAGLAYVGGGLLDGQCQASEFVGDLLGVIIGAADPCETPMYGSGRKASNGYQQRYRCRGTDNSGNRVGCGKTWRGSEPVDHFVTEAVLAKLDKLDLSQAFS